MSTDREADWTVARCRALLDDLRPARPAVYFADAGASAFAGWLLFAAAASPGAPVWRACAFAAAALLLYRALAFIHEIFHQQGMRRFRHFWHATAGVPLLLPFLLYQPVHQAHHNPGTYGTASDGEYEQFLGRRDAMLARLFGLNLLLPLALAVRFGVLTPLAAFVPFVRREVIPAFVHLALRMPYKAPPLAESARREARAVELACMAFAWALAGFALSGHWRAVLLWAALVVVVATLNTIRAVCSTHLYVEQEAGRDTRGQVADSLNIGGGWLRRLVCPAGLEYHALHHLAPYLPYHALDEAHERLMRALPADSFYRRATVGGLPQGWFRLVEATQPATTPGARALSSDRPS
jgi:fatty acid desaturase